MQVNKVTMRGYLAITHLKNKDWFATLALININANGSGNVYNGTKRKT